jgi:hypothetical protein
MEGIDKVVDQVLITSILEHVLEYTSQRPTTANKRRRRRRSAGVIGEKTIDQLSIVFSHLERLLGSTKVPEVGHFHSSKKFPRGGVSSLAALAIIVEDTFERQVVSIQWQRGTRRRLLEK